MSTPFLCRHLTPLLGAIVLLAGSLPLLGVEPDDAPPTATLPGHSAHGEAFNEGPRQPAYLMDGMPDVSFPVSTRNVRAQAFFNQGIGQLHGFWDFEAERSFRQVATLDPDCAMAYWGMAMANHKNSERAKGFIEQAVERKDNASPKEQVWIQALADFYGENRRSDRERRQNYTRALEALLYEDKEDVEAMAFLALHLWSSHNRGLPIQSALTFDRLLDDIFELAPMHPAHHYRIHLWDGEPAPLSVRALESAALCGQSGPGIAHLWHMSGHTYSKLHRYAEAAWQQEASVRTDNAQLVRDRILPDQIHNYAHNSEWMVANFNYIGRANRGIELAMNMIEMPRHPNLNTLNLQTNGIPYERRNGTSAQGRRRLMETLLRYELWEQTVALAETTYLEATDLAEEQGRRARLLAIAHLELGQPEQAQAQKHALQLAIESLRTERSAAVNAAEAAARHENKSAEDQQKAMADALQRYRRPLESLEKMAEEVAWLQQLRSTSEPSQETLGPLLETLEGVSKDRLSRYWFELGDHEKALKLAGEAVQQGTNQVQLLANQADLLWRAGESEKAVAVFEDLRSRSGWLELDLPVFQRLHPLVTHQGLPPDWRGAPEYPEDFGTRPDLASLGIFRWKPPTAPDWELPQADGTQLSLESFRGQPVLLVFYLGHSCEHCLQQLNALAPAEETFKQLGIQMVAVSADSVDALVRTQEQARDGAGFPFPIVADPSRRVFREFRAYDGFEDVPLHGVFLLDPDGRIRWQDVGYEPFEDVAFLAQESARQLDLYRDQAQLAKSKARTLQEARVTPALPAKGLILETD